MYISTKDLFAATMLAANLLSTDAALIERGDGKGADCSGDFVAKNFWYDSCAPGFHYSVCCPKSHPILSDAGREGKVHCTSGDEDVNPKAPDRCNKGWIALFNLYGGCMEGKTWDIPQEYWDGKC